VTSFLSHGIFCCSDLRVQLDVEASGDDALVRDAIRRSADGLVTLIRAAQGRKLTVMFPFIAQPDEFTTARAHLMRELARGKGMLIPA
jgi:hypothetical protein